MKVEQPLVSYGNPQKEDGYTPIANELLEAILRADFSKRQMLVILTIARMTFGYSKKSDALSGWQIASITGIDRSHISKTINELVELNVVKKLDLGRESHGIFVHELTINKHYKDWITVAKTATVADSSTVAKTATVTVAKTATVPLPKQPTHKAIKTIKTNIAKETSINSDFNINERVLIWAKKNGHTELERHLENFVLVCESKCYKYSNWDSAFMRAIKDNWAKIDPKKTNEILKGML